MIVNSIIEHIAKVADELDKLKAELNSQGFEFTECVIWESARCVTAKELNGHIVDIYDNQLDNSGPVDNMYYVYQKQGILDDQFYGKVYFPTHDPNCWVEAEFECF